MAYKRSNNYNRGNQLAQKKQEPVMNINAMTKSPAMQKRFAEVLGKSAPAFLAGVLGACNTNKSLLEADPQSVMSSAMVAATLNLSVVPSLGQAALVPYKTSVRIDGRWQKLNLCQFQLMKRGIIQLAQRSGQYLTINAGCIYEDEYRGDDLLTGEVRFERVKGGYRDQGDSKRIMGYFAYFQTVTGFKKTDFWTKEDVLAHAKKFSKTWNEDEQCFTAKTPWADNFDAMAEKTVLKHLLNNYGPLSVDSVLAEALRKDQIVMDTDGNGNYLDNPANASENESEEEKKEESPVVQDAEDASYDEVPDDVLDELNSLADFDGAEEF